MKGRDWKHPREGRCVRSAMHACIMLKPCTDAHACMHELRRYVMPKLTVNIYVPTSQRARERTAQAHRVRVRSSCTAQQLPVRGGGGEGGRRVLNTECLVWPCLGGVPAARAFRLPARTLQPGRTTSMLRVPTGEHEVQRHHDHMLSRACIAAGQHPGLCLGACPNAPRPCSLRSHAMAAGGCILCVGRCTVFFAMPTD